MPKRTVPNERQAKALQALIEGDDNRRIRHDQWKGTATIQIRDNVTDDVVCVLMLPTLKSLEKLSWIVRSSATDNPQTSPVFYDITRAGREALCWYMIGRGVLESRATVKCFGEVPMTAVRTVHHPQLRRYLDRTLNDPENHPGNDDRVY